MNVCMFCVDALIDASLRQNKGSFFAGAIAKGLGRRADNCYRNERKRDG